MQKQWLLIFILLLVACSRSDETATPISDGGDSDSGDSDDGDNETAVSTEPDTITLRMIVFDWEIGNYRTLIKTFEADNPGIKIKMVSLEETLGFDSNGFGQWPENATEQLLTAADIMSTNSIGTVNGSSGLLLDLRPLIEADSTFDRNDFYPNALENFEFNGGVWALPTELNFTLIFYNKDAFDAVNLDYPQPGWSWDDLLTAAQATTVREGDEVVQWGLVQSSRNPVEFIRPRAGILVDNTTDPPTPQFERPEVAETLQWYRDLFLLHEVAPVLEEPEIGEDGSFLPPEHELIENGEAAIWPEWGGVWQWRNTQVNLGVVPFPVDAPDDHTNQAYISGYAVSAGTRHPEAAWRWINFLSQQPSTDDFSADAAVPARRSVAEADGFWERVDSELGDTLRYALDHAYTSQHLPGYGAFSEAVQAVLNDGQSVEDALAEAQVQAVLEIAEFMAKQEGAEDVEIAVVAPQETAVTPDAITILFTASGGPGGIKVYRDLFDSFHQTHPNILVELQQPDYGSGGTYLHDVAAISDCMQWFSGISSAEDRAAILSIEPFLDADQEVNADEFYPSAIDAFSYQGQLWGLPAETSQTVIYYNKALFDAAGVPYPAPDWTMDDFLTTAVALTSGDDPETKQYGYVPQTIESNDLSDFIERLGAQFFDESVDPPQLTFTHPDTVAAMGWFTRLTTEYGVKPVFKTQVFSEGNINFGKDRKRLLENSRAAMWSDQGFDSFPETSLDGLDIGIVPLPTGVDGTAVIESLTTGYFISAETTQQQACWEWIKFLSVQPLIGSFGNTVPTRRSVAESPEYAQAVGADLAAANLTTLAGLAGSPASRRISNSADWLGQGFFWWKTFAYDQILQGNMSVEDVLADVQAKADTYRTCIIDHNGFEDRNIQRTCLGEADDTVPTFLIEVDES